jgi:hypothetical protein
MELNNLTKGNTMEWVNPPAAKRGRTSTKWSKIAAELKTKPNTWAKIGTVNYASQATIIGRTHGIKIVTRKNDEGTFDIYAMVELTDGE